MGKFIGSRIFQMPERVKKETIEGFRNLPASNIGDMMGRLYNSTSDLKSLNGVSMLGTAFTVKAPEGDNLLFHKALDIAQSGDVIVVDAGGGMERALAGEMMVRYAMDRGLAGFVVNGCMRDIAAIRAIPFPVYAKGVSPRGPYKNGPGELNVPVVAGGLVIFPGDILVGDADGIVAVRPSDAQNLLDNARKKFQAEQASISAHMTGGDRSWIDTYIDRAGIESQDYTWDH